MKLIPLFLLALCTFGELGSCQTWMSSGSFSQQSRARGPRAEKDGGALTQPATSVKLRRRQPPQLPRDEAEPARKAQKTDSTDTSHTGRTQQHAREPPTVHPPPGASSVQPLQSLPHPMDTVPDQVAVLVDTFRARARDAWRLVRSAPQHAPSQYDRRTRAWSRVHTKLRQLERVQRREPILPGLGTSGPRWASGRPSVLAQRYRDEIQQYAAEAARQQREGDMAGYYVAAHCAWQRKTQFERELPQFQAAEPGQPRWPRERRLMFRPLPEPRTRPRLPARTPDPGLRATGAAIAHHEQLEHVRRASLLAAVSRNRTFIVERGARAFHPPTHSSRTRPEVSQSAVPPSHGNQVVPHISPRPNTPPTLPMPPGLYEAVAPHLHALAGLNAPRRQHGDPASRPPAHVPPVPPGLFEDVAPHLDALRSGRHEPTSPRQDH